MSLYKPIYYIAYMGDARPVKRRREKSMKQHILRAELVKIPQFSLRRSRHRRGQGAIGMIN